MAGLGLRTGKGLNTKGEGRTVLPFISQNELEKALVQAVKAPASAPDFYRLLLEADLLVMGTAEGREDATEVFRLEPGGKLHLVPGARNGGTFLPVFSSLLRMQEYVKEESKYLSINGRALLELTRGATVILNPASEYGKELAPPEVAQLLGPPASRTLPFTGQAEYPMALVEILTQLFATRPDIQAAWMIGITFPGGEAHPLVGVELDSTMGGEWVSLMAAIQARAEQSIPGQVFDLQRIDRARPDNLTDALLQVPPFYQRGKTGPVIN